MGGEQVVAAGAEHAQPAELARRIRGHWSIENRLHWIRDVTSVSVFTRPHRQPRPQVMAVLRNVAISLLRFAGHTNIARAPYATPRHPDQAIALVTRTDTTTQ